MPLLPLIAMAAIQATPPPPAAAPAPPSPESRCSYIIRDAPGVSHPAEDPNLHVLDQTAAEGQFAPVKPAGAVGIQCWRTSVIPAAHDEEVILARMALIIAETTGPAPHRLGALDFVDGHFRFTMRTGTLTAAEQATVDARLAEFLARVHPSTPAH
jgi:hypothetical protein